jgi:hypothetical protein
MPTPRTPARRTYSYASAADVNVTTGVVTAIASAASLVTLTTGDFDGSVVLVGGTPSIAYLSPPRAVTVTRSASAGAFTTDPVVITGKRMGADVSTSMVQTTADGGDTLHSGILFDSLTTIEFPVAASGAGTFNVGVEDIGSADATGFLAVRTTAAGLLPLGFDEAGTLNDSIDSAASETHHVAARRVATANITVGFTVYVP